MSLLPAATNFDIWKGSTFRKQLTWYQGASTGPVVNLTGYTASCVLEATPGGTTLLTLTDANGGIILGGAAGTIQLYISAATTAALTWNSAVYELRLTAGSGGDTTTLLYGVFRVKGF